VNSRLRVESLITAAVTGALTTTVAFSALTAELGRDPAVTVTVCNAGLSNVNFPVALPS